MAQKQGENTGLMRGTKHAKDDQSLDFSAPRRSIFQIFFNFVRAFAVLISLLMMVCQFVIFARDDGVWLQNVLRIYVLLFCCLFISSELQLEERIRFLPAAQNWFTRGFLYSFIAVIGYEESTTLLVSDKGSTWIPAHIIVTALKLASWAMFFIGVLYALMGVLCFRKLRDRIQRRYDQERDDRERLQQLYYQNEV